MFYCLSAVQLIDNQLIARFIIVKCTDKYREIYGLISKNVRIVIVKYTDKYRKMYALLSLNVRIIIWEYTGIFWGKIPFKLSGNVRMMALLNPYSTIGEYTDDFEVKTPQLS